MDIQIAERVSRLSAPILEIGGPSAKGYHYLTGTILPSEPYVTNIRNTHITAGTNGRPDTGEYAYLVNEIVDGTALPYGDESVGMILMSCMPRNSDVIDWSTTSYETATALLQVSNDEMDAVAHGRIRPKDAEHSTRTKMYTEARRVLEPNGLLMLNGLAEQDIKVLELLGLKLVECIKKNDTEVHYPAAVFIKQPETQQNLSKRHIAARKLSTLLTRKQR